MEAAEMNPFITVKALGTILASHEHGEILKLVFRKELAGGKEDELCLPTLAETVNKRYN
jgi:hypothetical protein